MKRQTRLASFLSSCFVGLIALSIAAGNSAAQKMPGPPPLHNGLPPQTPTAQTTNIPYYTLRDGLDSTLILNNVVLSKTQITVTLFNLQGKSQVLPPITVDGHSFTEVDLAAVIKDADFDSGNIQVAFTGIPMAVTCQLTVSSAEERVAFESREQDMMDFMSTSLNGILWLPQKGAEGFLAVTNVSSQKVAAQLTVGSGKQKTISLNSRETQLVNLGDGLGQERPLSALVKLQQNGMPGDIITTAYVLNTQAGYSSAFLMLDPMVMKTSHLAGAHFLFGTPDPSEGFPAGTTFESPLLLANVSAAPITAHISVDYTFQPEGRDEDTKSSKTKPEAKFATVPVKDLTIPPGSIQTIELATELARLDVPTPVQEDGVDIAYEAAPGSLVGELTSMDQSGGYSMDVPIKDPGAMDEMMEGIYPWTLEDGTRTVLHLKNTTDKSMNALVEFTYPGGTYEVPSVHLAPYQTAAFDIQKLKESKTPDVAGWVIPASAINGQIVWHQQTPYSLIGRAEQTNLKEGIAESFSCGQDCCPYFNAGDFEAYPASLTGVVGGSGQVYIKEMGVDCSDHCFGMTNDGTCNWVFNTYGTNSAGYGWSSDDTSVATVDDYANVSYVGGGSTGVNGIYEYDWYEYDGEGSCEGYSDTTDYSKDASVAVCGYTVTPAAGITASDCDGLTSNHQTFQIAVMSGLPSSCNIGSISGCSISYTNLHGETQDLTTDDTVFQCDLDYYKDTSSVSYDLTVTVTAFAGYTVVDSGEQPIVCP